MAVINFSVSASSFKCSGCVFPVRGGCYDPNCLHPVGGGFPFEVHTYLFVITVSGE